MTEQEIEQMKQDNYKYIRALREIVIADSSSYMDSGHMIDSMKNIAREAVGEFEVSKWS